MPMGVMLVFALPTGFFFVCCYRSFLITQRIMNHLKTAYRDRWESVRSPYGHMPLLGQVLWVNPGRLRQLISSGGGDDELKALILAYRWNGRVALAAFSVCMLLNIGFIVLGILYN